MFGCGFGANCSMTLRLEPQQSQGGAMGCVCASFRCCRCGQIKTCLILSFLFLLCVRFTFCRSHGPAWPRISTGARHQREIQHHRMGHVVIIGWDASKSVFAANIHGTDLYHKEYDIVDVLECQDKTALNAMQGTTCVRMKHSDQKTWTRHCEILMVDDINISVSVTWHIDKTLDDVKFISGEPAQKKPRTMNWCAIDAS